MRYRSGKKLLNPNEDKYDAMINYACALEMIDEDLTLLLFALTKAAQKFGGRNKSEHWNMLVNLVGKEKVFLNYARKLIDLSRKDEIERILQCAMQLQKIMGPGDSSDILSFVDRHRHLIIALFPSGSAFWIKIPFAARKAVLRCFADLVQNNYFAVRLVGNAANGMLPTISKLAKYGKCISITLATIPIIYEVYRSVSLWWNGDISGKRAAQNIIDASVVAAGSIGGAAVGSYFGPVGALVGAMFGGLAGNLLKKLTQIFDLPKTEALEKAYQYLGVHHRASDAEVSEAYRKRLLIDHPDKGGSNEAFYKLQTYMAIIQAARGKKAD
uniref:J domain-containing protein n=1 Tax=Panagrolaimus sp. ES5 TaxID=591445 RepID=A0AC34FD17_9BILA